MEKITGGMGNGRERKGDRERKERREMREKEIPKDRMSGR